MLVILVIPTGSYLLITSRSVQTKIVSAFLDDIATKVGAEIHVKSVKVKFFNRVVIEDLLVKDQKDDTLIFVPKLEAEIDSFSLSEHRLVVDKAKIYSPDIRMIQDSAGVFNFAFLVDSLTPKDSVKNDWRISVNKMLMGNGMVLLDMSQNAKSNFKQPLRFNKTAITTTFNYIKKDSISIHLSLLKFIEDRGLHLSKMTGEFAYRKGVADFRNVNIETPESVLELKSLYFKSDSGFKTKDIGKAQFIADVSKLVLAPEEAQAYHSFFKRFRENLKFHGLVQGRVDNFRGKDLNLSIGNTADLLFDIDAYGLNQIEEAFYHADFKNFYINTRTFPGLYERLFRKEFPIQNELRKLGNVMYKGVLTGFYGDLVSYGSLSTDVGLVNTDLSLKKIPANGKIELSGNLSTEKFDLGTFFNWNEKVGNVTMKVELEGDKMPNEPFSLRIDGSADSLEFNNYTYNSVYLKGLFGNKNFNGGIDIRDPNLRLLFRGRIDFSNQLPIFKFETDVYEAFPSNLKLYDKFPNDKLQMRVKTELVGNSIDNLTGFIALSEIKYHNMNGLIEMEDASLLFKPAEKNSSIEINSDLLDISLEGQYNLGQIKTSLASIIAPYLPSVASQFKQGAEPLNNFTYTVSVHDFSDAARILELPFSVNSNGKIDGKVNDENRQLSMNMNIPELRFKGFDIKQLDVNISNKNMRPLSAVIHAGEIYMGKKKVNNLVSRWVGVSDEISTNTVWSNDQDKEFSGNINVDMAFSDSIENNLLTDILIKPSTLVLSDSIWHIDYSELNLDSSGIVIQDFRFGEGPRFIDAHGKLSRNNKDSLVVDLQNVDMKYLSDFIKVKKLDLEGMVKGNAVIYSGLKRPVILSDIKVNDLYINNVAADDLSVTSEWDNDLGLMNLSLSNVRGKREQLSMKGTYNPSNKAVDFYFDVNNSRVEYVQPYLESVVQDLRGTGSGPMHLYGTGKDLILEGYIVAKNSTVNIDYLNTSYFINDTIFFEKNNIAFKNFKISDRDRHEAYLTGNINHSTFKNMDYKLVIDFDNCLVLDTRERDNHLYYGTVYGTGVAGISGKGAKVLMDISGKTEPNTVFKLPLSTGEVAGESDFIRFTNSTTGIKEFDNNQDVIRDGTSGITLNLEVEATSNAYTELIFDSRVGDVIKGRGSGTLIFKYDTYEDFKMYGEYKVEDGEYLFTLQNIINKRFDIEPGGTITWGGDPYGAEINLDAYYGAKASLNELIPGFEAITGDNKRRIPVNCHMMLSEGLMNPSIKFDIKLPTAPQETQQQVGNLINTEDEMNRQIFSLLALNSFVTPDHLQAGSSGNISSQSAAMVTSFEFLSNQLSHWLSQISNDFDVGVNYRPSDFLTNQEIEVMLSTQIFDDKVSINGNFGYREMQAVENPSNFVGDFDVDVKLNPTGNLRLKAYTHTNDRIFYESKTKQGVGFIYKEEFNNWEELLEIYKLRKDNRERKREEKRKQKEFDKMDQAERTQPEDQELNE